MKLKLLSVLFLSIFFISVISASLGNFPINQCLDIKTMINTSAVTISTINYPDGTIAIQDEAMQNVAGKTWNYTFCLTNYSGVYNYDYYDTEGNTYVNDFSIGANASGNVIIFFSLIFIAIMFLLVWELIMSIGHFMNLDFDIKDLSKAWGTYFALLALYWLEITYLSNDTLTSWLSIFIKIGAFTHMIIPLIAFAISLTVGNLRKMKFNEQNMRYFKRTKLNRMSLT